MNRQGNRQGDGSYVYDKVSFEEYCVIKQGHHANDIRKNIERNMVSKGECK